MASRKECTCPSARFLFVSPVPSENYWEPFRDLDRSQEKLGKQAMFSNAGLALMLLDHATVEGRHLPPGSVGTEEDFGNDLPKLICQGLIFPFDPAKGLPPVPVNGKVPSYAYADFNA